MAGTIFRTNKRKNNFVQIDRKCLDDIRLSWKAKGLLSYMLSMKDGWIFYETELVKHSKDGIDALQTIVKELIKNGYMVKNRKRDEKGKYATTEIIVYESPIRVKSTSGKSTCGESTCGESTDGKHTTNNTDSK